MEYNPRLTKPESGNPFYNTTSNGGYSKCIVGEPTDAGCNVLANCVGYACGRFNEIIGSMKYPYFNCNAYNFIKRAQEYYPELQITNYPTLGGIMVFKKRGAEYGHVLIPEKFLSADATVFSESAWHGSAFYTATRYKSNGWMSGYDFLGNIVNPAIGDVHWVDPVPPTPGSYYKVVSDSGLWLLDDNGSKVRVYPNGTVVKVLNDGYDKYGYHYYHVQVYSNKEVGYMASEYLTPTESPEPPEPVTRKYKPGDKVIFSGVLYRDSFGNDPGQSRTNFVTTVYLVTNNPNATKPYNIANGLGWVAEEDLKPYEEPTQKIEVGDWVYPIKMVDYYGNSVVSYDSEYLVTELVGDRAVLKAKRNNTYVTWAAMNVNNLKLIRKG